MLHDSVISHRNLVFEILTTDQTYCKVTLSESWTKMLKVTLSIPEMIVRMLEFEERQGNKVAMWELNMKLKEFCGEALTFDEASSEAYKMAERGRIEIWFNAASRSQYLKAVPRHQTRVSFEGDFNKSVKFPITGDKIF